MGGKGGKKGAEGAEVDGPRPSPYMGGMNFSQRLLILRRAREVGRDQFGNRYYEERRARPGHRPRRFVIYGALEDASAVPPEWHAWLHYMTDAPLSAERRYPWEKPHRPNLTGTPYAYRPPGHDYRGGVRAPATGDYEPWTPEG